MRHKKVTHKLSRTKAHREALFRNLITSLILHDQIEITISKAKAIKPIAERLISNVQKSDSVIAIRYLNSYFYDKAASRKVMEILKDKYKDRKSGFLRMRRIKVRPGDAATIVRLELV